MSVSSEGIGKGSCFTFSMELLEVPQNKKSSKSCARKNVRTNSFSLFAIKEEKIDLEKSKSLSVIIAKND